MRAFLLFYLMCPVFAMAQDAPIKNSLEARRVLVPPTVDGKLNDAAWVGVPVATDFIQNRPSPGDAPTERTEIQFVYDDEAIYVAAHMFDSAPDSILHQLSQRDDLANTDWCGLVFGCFQDGINGFEFIVTPDGVQIDAQISANGKDFNWNAVWQCNTAITDDGWIAEFKIPYSAIRFPEGETQTWDMNFMREIRRHREQSSWTHIDPQVAGFINQSGELTGITNVDAPVRLFFYPYLSGYLERQGDGNGGGVYGTSYNGGMDLKFGLTDAFTLDATLIPDFGQVQSDNLVLNLSPFEVRFNENRQFFTEGTELFNKGGLFYSRRIGSSPVNGYKAYDELAENEEVSALPSTTQLLNAVKISGRNSGGTGIGFFNAISGREYATLRDTITGDTREIEVSPLTNYNILVVDQNLPNNSYATIINTNVSRDGSTYDANVIGTTFEIRNKKNSYSIEGSGAYNKKFGPNVDPASEDGFRWDAGINKISGNLQAGAWYSMESDTYDPNDLGFLYNANEVGAGGYLSYNIYEPFGAFNRMWSNLNINGGGLYKPNVFTNFNINLNGGVNTRKFHAMGLNAGANPVGSRDYFGPRTDGYFYQSPARYRISSWISTDYRKRFALDMNGFYGQSSQPGRYNVDLRISPRLRVNDKLFFSYVYSWGLDLNGEGYAFQDSHPDAQVVSDYEDQIIYAKRNRTSHTQVLNARYIFTNRMGLTARVRHYWSFLQNKSFLQLQEDGSVVHSNFPGIRDDGSSPLDQSFNAFNVDLVYTWVFSPGSQLSVVWKKSIATNMDQEQRISEWSDNFTQTLEAPGLDSFSIKLLYFVDYLTLRRGEKAIQN